MKEATTIFELALWKARIDQLEDGIHVSDRNGYRVEVPGPVQNTIMQYLYGMNLTPPWPYIKLAEPDERGQEYEQIAFDYADY